MLYEYQHSKGNHHFSVSERGSVDFNFHLHLHKSFEVVFVEEGELLVHISGNDFTVKAGECALVLPGQLHSYATPVHSLCYICIFAQDYTPDLDRYCRTEQKHYPVFVNSVPRLWDVLESATAQIFRIKSLLYDLAARYTAGPPYNEFKLENDSLICNIVSYIEEHYTEPLTLQQLASQFGYNYRYMSSVINRCFKTSFSQLVNQYRINYACNLLRENDLSITEISEQCGFDSQRNFNRNFKSFTGLTPREYMQKHF